MKKYKLLLLFLGTFIFFSIIAKGQVKSKSFSYVLKKLLKHNVPEIAVAKLAATNNNYLYLDAREYDEYAVSHIENARYIGYKKFDDKALLNVSKDKPIVVYCSIGKRSEDVSEKLLKQGYKNVSNLYGGIFEWVNQGHKVYNNAGKQTENVHAYNWMWGRFLNKGNKVY